ncbi:MAG: DUF4199 domain-containing protein [Odoribacter sp.]
MDQEKKKIFLKQNTIFGLFIGLSFIIVSFAFYKMDKGISFNPQLNNVIMLLSIVGAFIGTRKYKEESLQGQISYSGALGTCVYIITIASICYGLYIYLLYQQIPALKEDYLNTFEAALKEVYPDSPLVDNMTAMLKVFTTPAAIALGEIFNKIFSGSIFSLFLAGILRRNILKP